MQRWCCHTRWAIYRRITLSYVIRFIRFYGAISSAHYGVVHLQEVWPQHAIRYVSFISYIQFMMTWSATLEPLWTGFIRLKLNIVIWESIGQYLLQLTINHGLNIILLHSQLLPFFYGGGNRWPFEMSSAVESIRWPWPSAILLRCNFT